MGDAATFSSKGLDIFFQSKRASVDGQLTARLVHFIAETRSSLDCAIYDLRHPQVLAALRTLVRSGKQVRIAYDAGGPRKAGAIADPKPSGTEALLKKAGLLSRSVALHRTGKHLMHHKFLVRDSDAVWTGSANFTVGGLELQDNNCLVIRSKAVAKSYGATFEELVSSPPVITTVSTDKATKVDRAVVTAVFAPSSGEDIEQRIVAALSGAHRVRVMAFLISDPGILDTLHAFANPEALIQGVYDPGGMKDAMRSTTLDPSRFWFTADPRFVPAPSHAFNPKPGHEQDFMHNKVMIIDDHLVITGSYNFSENAETNEENTLIIDSPAVSAAYITYFETLFHHYGGTP